MSSRGAPILFFISLRYIPYRSTFTYGGGFVAQRFICNTTSNIRVHALPKYWRLYSFRADFHCNPADRVLDIGDVQPCMRPWWALLARKLHTMFGRLTAVMTAFDSSVALLDNTFDSASQQPPCWLRLLSNLTQLKYDSFWSVSFII